MAAPTLRGTRVLLRPPRPADVADRLAAGRDPEFRRMVGARPDAAPLTLGDAERWWNALVADPYGWVIDVDGRCVGEARLHHVDADRGDGWLALGLFARADRGHGIGTETVRLLLGHAFDTLGLARIGVRVLAFNARAVACYRRCGFRELAREPARLDGGEVAEDILMEVTSVERAGPAPDAP